MMVTSIELHALMPALVTLALWCQWSQGCRRGQTESCIFSLSSYPIEFKLLNYIFQFGMWVNWECVLLFEIWFLRIVSCIDSFKSIKFKLVWVFVKVSVYFSLEKQNGCAIFKKNCAWVKCYSIFFAWYSSDVNFCYRREPYLYTFFWCRKKKCFRWQMVLSVYANSGILEGIRHL